MTAEIVLLETTLPGAWDEEQVIAFATPLVEAQLLGSYDAA